MLVSHEITRMIADAYRESALANANMKNAVDVLESIRSAMLEMKSLFEVWDTFDDQIGRAEADRFQPVLVELRTRFEQLAYSSEISRLNELFKGEPENGWAEWLRTYAEALTLWRLSLCSVLLETSFAFPEHAEEFFQDIKQHTKNVIQERWPEAYGLYIQLADQDVVSDPQKARLIVVAGEIQLYHIMKPDEAKKLFDRAEELAPTDVKSICGLGGYWMQQNEIEKAMRYFERAIDVAPDFSDGYLYMGDCHKKQNRYDLAEESYQQAIDVAPGDAQVYIRLVRLYGRQELFSERESNLMPLVRRAVAVEPLSEYSTYLEMAYVYQQNDEYEKAYQWYQQAIELDSSRLDGYTSNGYAYLAERKYSQAHDCFQKAIEVAPEAFDGYWGMVWLYEQQEQWSEVIDWCEKSLPRRPEWQSMIRGKIGEMKWKLQRYSEAEEELLKALRDEPDNEMVLRVLHDLADDYYQELRDDGLALQLYNQILQIKGRDYEANHQNRVGNLHYYLGKYDEAAAAYRNAIALAHDEIVYHSNLAGAYREMRNWDKAIEEVETAFGLSKDENEYKEGMAFIINAQGNECFSQSDYGTAIKKYEEAIQLQPDYATYHSNLALAWEYQETPGEKLTTLGKAISSLETACRLSPENAEYSEKLDELKEKMNLGLHFGEQNLDRLAVVTPVAMEVAGNLISYIQGDAEGGLSDVISSHISDMRERILGKFGVKAPGIRFTGNETDLPDGYYIIMIMEAPLASGNISLDRRLLTDSLERMALLNIPGEETENPMTGDPAFWIALKDWEKAKAGGIRLWDIVEYPIRHLEAVIQRNLPEFLGHQEVMELLDARETESRAEIKDSPEKFTNFTIVLRSLLSEEVPITAFDEICEAFSHLSESQLHLTAIVEEMRSIPEIQPVLPGNNDRYFFYQLGRRFEAAIDRSIYSAGAEPVLAMEPDICQEALAAVRGKVESERHAAVLVENAVLRPFVRRLVEIEFPGVFVLSRRELLPEPGRNIVGEIELG